MTRFPMPFARSPETEFLLGCIRRAKPEELGEISRRNLNWSAVLEKAVQYEILPLVHCNVQRILRDGHVPQQAAGEIGLKYYQDAVQSIALNRALRELLLQFSRANVPVIVLKGAALGALVYEHFSLRPMRDIDLLVRREDLEAADQALRSLHYAQEAAPAARERYEREHHHLAPHVSPDGAVHIELHLDIVPRPERLGISIEDLWARSRPFSTEGGTARCFAPEDLLLHACLHLSYLDCFTGKLRAVWDIAELLRRFERELDWDRLLGQTRPCGIERYLYYPLWLAQNLGRAPVPEETMRALRRSARIGALEDRWMKPVIAGAVFEHDFAFLPQWLMEEVCKEFLPAGLSARGTGRVLKVLIRRLVASAERTVSLPRFAVPLYAVLVHPLYLGARAAVRLARRAGRV